MLAISQQEGKNPSVTSNSKDALALPKVSELSKEEKERQIQEYSELSSRNLQHIKYLSWMPLSKEMNGVDWCFRFNEESFKKTEQNLANLANFDEGIEVKKTYQQELRNHKASVSNEISKICEEIRKGGMANYEMLSEEGKKEARELFTKLNYNIALVHLINRCAGGELQGQDSTLEAGIDLSKKLSDAIKDRSDLELELKILEKRVAAENIEELSSVGKQIGLIQATKSMEQYAGNQPLELLGGELFATLLEVHNRIDTLAKDLDKEIKPILDNLREGVVELSDLSALKRLDKAAHDLNVLMEHVAYAENKDLDRSVLLAPPGYFLSYSLSKENKEALLNKMSPMLSEIHAHLVEGISKGLFDEVAKDISGLADFYAFMNEIGIGRDLKGFQPDVSWFDNLKEVVLARKETELMNALHGIPKGGEAVADLDKNLAFLTYLHMRAETVRNGNEIQGLSFNNLDNSKLAFREEQAKELISKSVKLILEAESLEEKSRLFSILSKVITYSDGHLSNDSKHEIGKLLANGTTQDAESLGKVLAEGFMGIDAMKLVSSQGAKDLDTVRDYVSFNEANVRSLDNLHAKEFLSLPFRVNLAREFIIGNDSLHRRTFSAFGYSILEDRKDEKVRVPVYAERMVREDVRRDLPQLHSFILEIIDSAQFSRDAAKNIMGLDVSQPIGKSEERLMLNSLVSLNSFIKNLPDEVGLKAESQDVRITITDREKMIFNEDLVDLIQNQYLNSALGSGMLYNFYALASPDTRPFAFELIIRSLSSGSINPKEEKLYKENLKYILYGSTGSGEKVGNGIFSKLSLDEKKRVVDYVLDSNKGEVVLSSMVSTLGEVLGSDVELNLYLEEKMEKN